MDENPYESPQSPPENTPTNRPARRMTLAIVLGILTLPAMGIAFFVTCFGTMVSKEGSGAAFDEAFSFGLIAGSLAGLAVAGTMVFFTVRAVRGRSQ